MDRIDHAIIRELDEDARISMAELGKRLGVAPSTAYKRIEKLRAAGIISRFTIEIDPDYYHDTLVTFLSIQVDPERKAEVEEALLGLSQVLEVYETLEPADFLARVRVSSISSLKEEILMPLSALDGVREMRTILTVRTLKEGGRIIPEGF